MDIKWKDGNGNIFNANNDRIIYLDAETGVKTFFKKEEVKKIIIDDGMMNIFRDFDNDLAITIVIPNKHKRNAIRVFNEFDKTGTMFKRQPNTFLLDLILESSIILGSPFLGIFAFLGLFAIAMALITLGFVSLFGEYGLIIVRVFFVSYIIYNIAYFIWIKIKRKKNKEI